MIVGMDFGTTNSGMAVYDGQSIEVLPLDPANANPRVLRTAMYITNEQNIHIGRPAIDRYYEHNIGRIVKTRKVWIGEIEVYAEDLYYVTDAYAWVDISEPGRLFLSIKSRLREEDHPGAVVGPYFYSLEDLIALYLTVTRVRAEQLLKRDIRQVVLGRPVHFSTDEEHDRLAQGRLLQAAFRAGYEKVYLQYEPVAAAYSYGTTITEEQKVLVFDFGGGTLDITVMALNPSGEAQVLSTGGIPVAGDIFDQKLTRAKLPKHFGEGTLYGPRHKAKQTPRWIYDAFSNWQTIIELQTRENRRVLQEIARTAQRRYQIEALISLVTSNYGLKMFDQVEKAKRFLSDKRGAEIRLDGPDFRVREFVTRTEFERIIRADILSIESELMRTLEASQLEAEEIDAVVRTGGSAQIPVFNEILTRVFGPQKVQSVNTFSSVTSGLGVLAHKIETGAIKAHSYTADDVTPPPQARGSRPRISQANLDLMKKRIILNEGGADRAPIDDLVAIFLGPEKEITAAPFSGTGLTEEKIIPLQRFELPFVPRQIMLSLPQEQLLLITSQYRFLLVSPRQILDLKAINMKLSSHHRMAEREDISIIGSWSKIREQERLLIVTSRGFARTFPINILQANVEGPVPFKLDDPLPGLPVAVFGVQPDSQFVLVSENGRGWRWSIDSLRLSGTQAMNCAQDDYITAAAIVDPDQELLLLTDDGYGRRMKSAWFPIPSKPNKNGRSLIARRSPLLIVAHPPMALFTTNNLREAPFSDFPLEKSTKTYRPLKLNSQEKFLGQFQLPR